MIDIYMVNVAADIDEVRDIILALTFAHFIGQREFGDAQSFQSNPTPMLVPCGWRNNRNQDRPVFGQLDLWAA